MELDCGIAFQRIEPWLRDELELEQDASSRWVFSDGDGQCLVAIEPLENRELGTVSFERTRLTATGDEGALAAFEHLFTLRFLSAGG